MADPRDSDDFLNGLLVGLLLAGGDEDGPDFEEIEFFLRDRFRERWPFPFPFRRLSRRRHRLAQLEDRVSVLQGQLDRVVPALGSFAWALSAGARPDDMDQLAALPVRVYLEDGRNAPYALVGAVQRFVESLGFDTITTGLPESGSFRQRFVSAFRGFFSRAETQAAIEKGTRAIELQLLDRPQADATKALAEATASLLAQVKDQKGGVCLQVGSLLLVRYRPDGKDDFVTVVRTLSALQLRRLEENQAQLDEPNKILGWLGISSSGRALPSPE